MIMQILLVLNKQFKHLMGAPHETRLITINIQRRITVDQVP